MTQDNKTKTCEHCGTIGGYFTPPDGKHPIACIVCNPDDRLPGDGSLAWAGALCLLVSAACVIGAVIFATQ